MTSCLKFNLNNNFFILQIAYSLTSRGDLKRKLEYAFVSIYNNIFLVDKNASSTYAYFFVKRRYMTLMAMGIWTRTS